MENFAHDLRHSVRILLKNPSFTLVAIGALALGIGANTAIFSVVDAVLLLPLPYPEPERLVFVERQFPQGTGDSTSIPKFNVWKQNEALEFMSAYDFAGPGLNLSGGDMPEQVRGIHASLDYFRLFGASPVLGRTFLPEEDRPGGPRVARLAYGLWKRRLGGAPGIVGRPVTLGGGLRTVVGILGPDFKSDPPAEVWLPLQADPSSTNQGHYLRVAARLRPGVTLDAANAHMKLVGERFRRQHPQWMGPQEGVAALPMRERIVGDVRTALLVLVGSVGFVLLIACANVANLLLARAVGRQREIAIRSALGAGRGRIMRQLLTESVLLAGLGGALGLALASWGVRILLRLSPGDIPRVSEIAAGGSPLDWRVLAFTFAITLATGILFGLVPALQYSNPDVNSTLKEAGARSGAGLRSHLARQALVVGEMVLALVLVIGAGLLIRTFIGLRSVPTGFDPRNVLAMEMSLAGARYASTAQVESLTRRVVERLESLPGVVAAAPAVSLPTQSIGIDLPFSIEGKPPADGGRYNGDEFWRYIGHDYFKVFSIPLLQGRFFTESDGRAAPQVVIVNEAFARRYFPKEDPLGRRILIAKGLGPEFEDLPRQIVAIVGDVREGGLKRRPDPVLYVPVGQVPDGMMRLGNQILPTNWIVRTATSPASLRPAIQREFLAVDSQLPVTKIRTMETVVAEGLARENFNTLLLGVFAGIALVLAAIGIYGVMSYAVEARTREIGIRMALAAGRRETVALIVGQGMRLVGLGIGLGLAAAFGLTGLMTTLLFGVKPTDPFTFIVVPVVLSSVALLATFIPARRATKVDPVIALRYE